MEQYIPKSVLVAKIDKRIMDAPIDCYGHQRVWAYNDVKDIINTLEVKEVDLDFEIKEDWLMSDKTEVDCLECMCLTEDMFVCLAKKYFELGLKAQKL